MKHGNATIIRLCLLTVLVSTLSACVKEFPTASSLVPDPRESAREAVREKISNTVRDTTSDAINSVSQPVYQSQSVVQSKVEGAARVPVYPADQPPSQFERGSSTTATAATVNISRVERLERIIEALDQRVRQLEAEKTTSRVAVAAPPKPTVDPLVGNWQCSAGNQTRYLTVMADGHLIIEETMRGTINKAKWIRLDDTRVTISGETRYDVRFNSANECELVDANRRSAGICRRQP